MRVIFSHKGSFANTEKLLNSTKRNDFNRILKVYGEAGVTALASATPVDTGETSGAWDYRIKKRRNGYSLEWYNTVMAGDTPLVILLQYGHATRSGTYVQGRDFINPAMKPILDRLAEDIWKEVTK